MQRPSPDGERVIKRYSNRKLYDPQTRRYVTLEGLAALVAEGLEILVLDQKTGEDLTQIVLAQVVLEGLKQHTARIPRRVLTRLIRLSWDRATDWSEWAGPQEAASRARQEAERIVSDLLSRGRLTLDDALALRQEMTQSVQRIVADTERGLDSRLRGILERAETRADVGPALESLKERLLSFETTVLEPQDAATGRSRRRPQRRKTGRKPKRTRSGN